MFAELAQYVYPTRETVELTGKDGEPLSVTMMPWSCPKCFIRHRQGAFGCPTAVTTNNDVVFGMASMLAILYELGGGKKFNLFARSTRIGLAGKDEREVGRRKYRSDSHASHPH